jgi:hypothetical protein
MGALPTFKTAPQIILTHPNGSAQEVPQETVISATFDIPMDPATIDGDNFQVSGQGGDRNGTLSYDPLSKTATFAPDQPFDSGETVQVQLISGITSLWGQALTADYGWSFQITTGTEVIVTDPDGLPGRFALHQNFPNPFNAGTTIRFSIGRPGLVTLGVYNILGQLIKTLYLGELPAGNQQISWNSTDRFDQPLASGVYFCRLEANGQSKIMRMVLLK